MRAGGNTFRNLPATSAYSHYEAASWPANPAQDPAGLFTPTYSQYAQSQGPSNAHNGAEWANYAPETGSPSLNYYNEQHPYSFVHASETSRPDSISPNYFAPNYTNNVGNPLQHNAVAPNQLQHVFSNESHNSDRAQRTPGAGGVVRVKFYPPKAFVLTWRFQSLLQRRIMRIPCQLHFIRSSRPPLNPQRIL